MSSRYHRSDPDLPDFEKPSACSSFFHYTWKTITCLLSHITLICMVVSYCVLGAFTFEHLEVHHEKEVKRNVIKLRYNVTDHLWNLTNKLLVLKRDNFTQEALVYLREFEGAILKAMTKDGWDGEEDVDKVQWTTTGALFYSIIVITTIGYGHIAPKTDWGKIVTIFYAILGIPLMLLCLSNIGDIMATSFRFLYWRVCCYMCAKKPKRRRNKSRTISRANSDSRFSRSRNASFRRSVRTSTKSGDSGCAMSSDLGQYSHSDTELRINNRQESAANRGSSLPRMKVDRKISANSNNGKMKSDFFEMDLMDKSNREKDSSLLKLDPLSMDKTPILCNRYVCVDLNPNKAAAATAAPSQANYLELPRNRSPSGASDASSSRRHSRRRKSPPHMNPSPKMMTPLGYGHRSKYLDDPDSDSDLYYDSEHETVRQRIKPVPIWLCVFLVVSYIIAGAFLFNSWESWELLDAAYFCFITLTTIGFGDLVPAKGVSQDAYRATVSIALCSLYLLFGIALLAMSFNLVQEEVIANVKNVAKRLGIIKVEAESDSDSDG